MLAELKINRIKSANRGTLGLLGQVASAAQIRNPKIATTAAHRRDFRDMSETLSALGAYCRKNGFDPTRTFQHVANFDTEIWTLILDMFAKYDPETGELMDDGLLYKFDQSYGCVRLNKDFFFAIIDYLESCGFTCDMRAKVNVH